MSSNIYSAPNVPFPSRDGAVASLGSDAMDTLRPSDTKSLNDISNVNEDQLEAVET